MYGKIFVSTFTGSMFGAGPDVFAVWSYVIASTVAGSVELNPIYLGSIIGMKPEAVEAAIEKLSAPDPRSRNQDFEGRRLIREGQFQYSVPSHETYREMRTEDARREYQRTWIKNKRSKENGSLIDRVDIDTSRHDLDSSTPAYESSGSGTGDPDQTRSTTNAKPPWKAHDWKRWFSMAWSEAYNTMALPGGGAAAAKATGDLDEELDRLPAAARAAAEGRATAMFREFLADRSPATVKARHPWTWFVTRFGGLLVPEQTTPPRPPPARVIEMPNLPKFEPMPAEMRARLHGSPAVASSGAGPHPAGIRPPGSATNAS